MGGAGWGELGAEQVRSWGGLRAAGLDYRGEESIRILSQCHGIVDGYRPSEGPGSHLASLGPSVPRILSAAEEGRLS